MKTKILLPMIAMIFAIGMSFASVSTGILQGKDFVHLGGDNWREIPELPCDRGPNTCQVMIGESGPFDVYDEMNLNSKRDTDREIPFVINP